jgi:hypothetical protein
VRSPAVCKVRGEIDDNPVECAEVQAAWPEVVTLRIPSDELVEEFVRHVWVFDRLFTTSEDRQRTALYKDEPDRARSLLGLVSLETATKGTDDCRMCRRRLSVSRSYRLRLDPFGLGNNSAQFVENLLAAKAVLVGFFRNDAGGIE